MKRILKVLRPKFAFGLARNILLKLRYGKALQFNLFRTYFSPSALVEILGGEKIIVDESGSKRVYVSRGCVLRASGGVLRIGQGAFLNQNCIVVSHTAISIGEDAMFGPNVNVFDSDHAYQDTTRPFSVQGYIKRAVSIGGNCWLGANVVVTKGSVIENNVVVGANSLVKGHIPGGSLAAGNPARVVRDIGSSAKRSG